MSHPPILIVDEHNKPTGKAQMHEAHRRGLYHRIVRVMVSDNRGRILLQKRSPNMATSPNEWDHSAAGHVDYGETDNEAAAREAREEIGLPNANLTLAGSWKSNNNLPDGRVLNRFNILYKASVNNFEPKAQISEVAELKWFTLDEIKSLIIDHPGLVTSGLVYAIDNYY